MLDNFFQNWRTTTVKGAAFKVNPEFPQWPKWKRAQYQVRVLGGAFKLRIFREPKGTSFKKSLFWKAANGYGIAVTRFRKRAQVRVQAQVRRPRAAEQRAQVVAAGEQIRNIHARMDQAMEDRRRRRERVPAPQVIAVDPRQPDVVQAVQQEAQGQAGIPALGVVGGLRNAALEQNMDPFIMELLRHEARAEAAHQMRNALGIEQAARNEAVAAVGDDNDPEFRRLDYWDEQR